MNYSASSFEKSDTLAVQLDGDFYRDGDRDSEITSSTVIHDSQSSRKGKLAKQMCLIVGALFLVSIGSATKAQEYGIRSLECTSAVPIESGERNSPLAASNLRTLDDVSLVSHPVGRRTHAKSAFEQQYNCTDDRMRHEVKLMAGVSICSKKNSYVYGFDGKRDLDLRRIGNKGKAKTYYSRTTTNGANNHRAQYFMLSLNATMAVYDQNGEVLWHRPCKEAVRFTKRCLPQYDCPYLHLHSDGVIVLNWINAGGSWEIHNINKMYDF